MSQRYISNELTHFVGRHQLKEQERYETLTRILKEGVLKYSHDSQPSSGLALITHPDAKASKNEVYDPLVICFCDIPLADLPIHMNKYSKFGISFLKSFLTKNGANPVFYIASDSIYNEISESKHVSLGDLFDKMLREYHRLMWEQAMRLKEEHFKKCGLVLGKEGSLTADEIHKLQTTEDPEGESWNKLNFFLDFNVFSFIKFFESNKSDEDPDNYYMEREWRLLGNLKFNLSDVYRIIIPKAYVKDLRRDLPEYNGQISFSDNEK
jgi:hypothetical protein